MIVICGATIAEVERDLEMAKQAIATGMPCGVGGETLADAENGLALMKQMIPEGHDELETALMEMLSALLP